MIPYGKGYCRAGTAGRLFFNGKGKLPIGSGFTLIEVLLVIALIGLLSTLLLANWPNLVASFGGRSAAGSLEEAFRRGHFLAETRGRTLSLRYSGEEFALILSDGESGQALETFPIPEGIEIRIVERSGSETGSLRSESKDRIVFGLDGSATAARIEVKKGSQMERYRNHPFSGELLSADAEDVPGARVR